MNGLPLSLQMAARSTLVCNEKFERIETSQFLLFACFTKHDYL
jgi:hypothetical protein